MITIFIFREKKFIRSEKFKNLTEAKEREILLLSIGYSVLFELGVG